MNDEIGKEGIDYQCPFLGQCKFVCDNEGKFPDLIARIQRNYCTKSACSRCARFQIYQALGPDMAPPLMLPDQTEWARQIIEEYTPDVVHKRGTKI